MRSATAASAVSVRAGKMNGVSVKMSIPAPAAGSGAR